MFRQKGHFSAANLISICLVYFVLFQNASGISISVQRRRLLGQPALAEPTAWRTFFTLVHRCRARIDYIESQRSPTILSTSGYFGSPRLYRCYL
ncbi:hypothetical protein BGW80DRAFT_912786 [Lactifluus volemus]|nr:hypothetical protein BGW80DRAFT_912786 [Lactifluus volemus]